MQPLFFCGCERSLNFLDSVMQWRILLYSIQPALLFVYLGTSGYYVHNHKDSAESQAERRPVTVCKHADWDMAE